jgi:Family of unknown function (DUF6064)
MPEWWTYGLSDIVMFTRETYYRLFESYNRAIWPAHVLALGAGVGVGLLLRRGGARSGRIAAAILSATWLWVAIAFHARRYADINWAASYFSAAFALEAALLLGLGVVRGRLVFETIRTGGLALFVFALAVQPLVGLLFGREWRQLEIFGIAPDPTAVGTIGVLLLAAGRRRWELLGIPLAWCAVSGVMLLAVNAPDAWLTLVPGAAALVLAIATSARAAGGTGSSRSTRWPSSRAL